LGPYPLENDNCPKRKNTHHISVSFCGEFPPLADKNESSATQTEDICEKKVAKSLLGFEGKLSEIAIFRQ
jgi:hypothetical protein